MHKYNRQIRLLEMAYGLGGHSTPITPQAFVDIVVAFDNSNKGAQPISFTSVTSPVLKSVKAGFMPYAKLYKVGQTNGMLGTEYGGNVNAQREREGKAADFVAGPNKVVKHWVSESVGITHKGNTVFKYRPVNSSPSYFVVENNDGTLTEISKEEAVQYLRPVPPSTNQGLEKEIPYRLYGVDKIVAVNFQKNEYLIEQPDTTRFEVFSIVSDKLKT